MDSKTYHGWKIYTHVGKVSPQEAPYLERKIESRLDVGIKQPIQIVFKYDTTEQEESLGLRKYGIVIQSDFFGLQRNEYAHQQLCWDVYHRISWQKEACLVMDNELVPLPTRHPLRMK